MGPAIPVIQVVAAVVGAGAAVKGAVDARKAGKAQEEQARQQQASNVSEAARQRRIALRRARASQAAIEAAGISSGTVGSSADLAVGQGQAGQVADAASKTSGQLLAVGNMSAQNQIMSAAQRRQQTFASIGNFANSAFNTTLQTEAGRQSLQNFVG